MDHTPGYFPGHYYRVARGPYEGVVGQWAGVFAKNVIGLVWPGMPMEFGSIRPIQFRLEDLEDLTPVTEVPDAFRS